MNIFQQDTHTIAAEVLSKMARFTGRHIVYVREDGRVQMEREGREKLARVGDSDIVGCYTRDSDPADVAEDLEARSREVIQLREIMR